MFLLMLTSAECKRLLNYSHKSVQLRESFGGRKTFHVLFRINASVIGALQRHQRF